MPAIYPLAASRVSDRLLTERLLSQFQFDNQELLRLQDQLSTGQRLRVPSDDAPAATRAITLQRILEQKEQSKVSVNTSRSYVSATDSALSSVSALLTNIHAEALSAGDATTSDTQRGVISAEVRRALEQFVDIGNRKFRGRSLFAGSQSSQQPFAIRGSHVVYRGNETDLKSLIDGDFVLDTNVHGDEVFGAISPAVLGSADLNPVLTQDSKLANLRSGAGITRGSFVISDGFSTKTIDISSAETIGDVVRLIEGNPPDGREVIVRLARDGLVVDIDDAGGGNLTIREVTGGTTAGELGIRDTSGVGVASLVGADLDALLTRTTPLRDLLGTRATALLESPGEHNDIFVEAVENGSQYNGVQIQYVSSGTLAGNAASATYDATAKTLTIDFNGITTTAATVVEAINATQSFSARLDDKRDAKNDGSSPIDPTINATLAGGEGVVLDRESGLQIRNGGTTHTITFDQAETVEDLLNVLNGSAADVVATISGDGRGIDVRSRLSGADFHIGENGGTTATELGIRTLTRDTLLSDLNYGRGLDVTGGNDLLIGDPAFTAAPGPHVDFTIQRKDGTQLDIDVSSSITVGDAIDAINNAAGEQIARLTAFGNGIEIIDENTAASGALTITRVDSFAAWDLGLLDRGTQTGTAAVAAPATASLRFPLPNQLNSAVTVSSNQAGFAFNNVDIVFQDTLTGDNAQAAFDAANNLLTIEISSGSTTANTVAAAINAEATGTFSASLDLSADPTNDGTGLVTPITARTSGGAAERVLGDDVNPLETEGVFNSLLRLSDALTNNDLPGIQRAVNMLDDDFQRLIFARAELGARERSLNVLSDRLDEEDVQLRATLSQEIDADLVESISELSARQANMEATLRLVGQTLQLSVLNFL